MYALDQENMYILSHTGIFKVSIRLSDLKSLMVLLYYDAITNITYNNLTWIMDFLQNDKFALHRDITTVSS